MSRPKLYKILTPEGFSCHGGNAQWCLPHGKRPGKWMPKREACLCYRGYHAVRASSLLDWLSMDNAIVYLAEGRGLSENNGEKWCFEQMRLHGPVMLWTPRIARLFACDCAERVLGIFERNHPEDMRPRQAIDVARRYANEEATGKELQAAWDAAWDAAWAAARAAARDAAGAAAGAAAWADAWDAAWAAERRWQTRRLMKYLSESV